MTKLVSNYRTVCKTYFNRENMLTAHSISVAAWDWRRRSLRDELQP